MTVDSLLFTLVVLKWIRVASYSIFCSYIRIDTTSYRGQENFHLVGTKAVLLSSRSTLQVLLTSTLVFGVN